jgi:ribonucleoside-diphosphate reductase alpha chain
VAADALPLEAHLAIPAAAQPFIDSAVSKTVNAPQDWPLESFALVFDRAFDLGLKGCAAFRPSPARAGLLQACAASPVACD